MELTMKEFLECYPPPQTGLLMNDVPRQLIADAGVNLTAGTKLIFHRKVSPNVPVTFQDPWGSQRSDRWIKVTLSVDFPATFHLLPYDPVSDDPSPEHVYETVHDLIQAFPIYAKANVDYSGTIRPKNSFSAGDIIKLIAVIYKQEKKLLECRLIDDSQLFHLPMTCRGNFTVASTNNSYQLVDLVGFVPRKRRVLLEGNNKDKIPGLPSDYKGDVYIKEPEYFVEASPANQPGLIIGLPHNLNMSIRPIESDEDRILLNSFATNNRHLFPLVAKVTDWAEETTILENHFVRPGTELVIHGWTRQSKILAYQDQGNYYAIPLTYQGKFRMTPQQFESVAELERAHPAYLLRVMEVDMAEPNCPVSRDDVIRIKRADSYKKSKSGEVKYLKVERVSHRGSARIKEVKLPYNARIKFEEVTENQSGKDFQIKNLVSFMTGQPLPVQLIQESPDQKFKERDLPLYETIYLVQSIQESAVYVSVSAVDAPAFHIPLRTKIFVSFVEQLDRSMSPLLTKQNPKLSTLDRCAEILSTGAYHQLMSVKESATPMFVSTPPVTSATLPEKSWVSSSSSSVKEHHVSNNIDTHSVKAVAQDYRQDGNVANRKHNSTENIFRTMHNESAHLSLTRNGSSHPLEVDKVQEIRSQPQRGYSSYNEYTSQPSPQSTMSSQSPLQSPAVNVGVPNGGFLTPPGYVLMPTAQAQAIPAGFSLVPVNYPMASHPAMSYVGSYRGPPSTILDEDDDFDDARSDVSKFTVSKSHSFKVVIPPDGNLYHFSHKKFIDLLRLMKFEDRAIKECVAGKIDGKKFSRMAEHDLKHYGILHPIVIYFRRHTSRNKAASKFTL